MNMELIIKKHESLINEANLYMDKINYYEHNHNHIKDVVNNTLLIMNNLEEEFNLEACIIGAYWHDVGRVICNKGHEIKSSDMLRDTMEKLCYSEDFINICCEAIKYHKWNMEPITIEGHILKDADKLAFIGINRWRECTENNYKLDDIIELLPKLRNEILHFDISKELYDIQICELVKYLTYK